MSAVRHVVLVFHCPCDPKQNDQCLLDKLLAWLHIETQRGRDHQATAFPGVTAAMVAAYRECPERN